MIYAEAAYFDGYHVAHVAAWERARIERHRKGNLARHMLANPRPSNLCK